MSLVRNIALIVAVLAVFSSCERDDGIASQRTEIIALDAFLKTGEPVSDINLRSLTHNGESEGLSGLNVYLKTEARVMKLEEHGSEAGHYSAEDRNFLIEEGEEYRLTLEYNDEVVTASTIAPPALEDIRLSNNVFNSENENELLFIEWTGINQGSAEYFYVVRLTPIGDEEMLVPIDDGKSASSARSVGEVLLNPKATLRLEDFNYYGDHLVEVFAISNTYKEYFLPHSDFSQNGATNVENGVGYFLGVSRLKAFIEVR